MSNTDWKDFEKNFGGGKQILRLVLYGSFLFAGAQAFIILLLGPVVGPFASFALVILMLLVVGFVFARTVKLIKVRRKMNQTALRCAYCKELSSSRETISCPSCSALYHQDCYSLNHGCTTFACKLASKADVKFTTKSG